MVPRGRCAPCTRRLDFSARLRGPVVAGRARAQKPRGGSLARRARRNGTIPIPGAPVPGERRRPRDSRPRDSRPRHREIPRCRGQMASRGGRCRVSEPDTPARADPPELVTSGGGCAFGRRTSAAAGCGGSRCEPASPFARRSVPHALHRVQCAAVNRTPQLRPQQCRRFTRSRQRPRPAAPAPPCTPPCAASMPSADKPGYSTPPSCRPYSA
jgi:hypothetical protein